MPLLKPNITRQLHSSLLTASILTFAEILMFYMYYTRRTERSMKRLVESSVRTLSDEVRTDAILVDDVVYIQSQAVLDYKLNRAIEQRKLNNRRVLAVSVVLLLTIWIMTAIALFDSPIRPSFRAVLGQSVLNVVTVLAVQYLFIVYFVDKTRSTLSVKLPHMIAGRVLDAARQVEERNAIQPKCTLPQQELDTV